MALAQRHVEFLETHKLNADQNAGFEFKLSTCYYYPLV